MAFLLHKPHLLPLPPTPHTHSSPETMHEWAGGQGDQEAPWCNPGGQVRFQAGNMEAETEHLVGHFGGGRNQEKEIGVRAGVVLGDSS